MKLSVKAMAISCGVIWGGSMLTCGLINLAKGSYARKFLKMMSTMYPGFHNSRTVPDVFVGAGYAFTDGAAAGALFATVYNRVAGRSATATGSIEQPEYSSQSLL